MNTENLLSLFQQYVGDLTVPNNALSVIMTILYHTRRETFTTKQLLEIRDTLQQGENINISHYLLQLPTATIDNLISVLSRSNTRDFFVNGYFNIQ